jgi:hypothetical protein
MKKSMMTLFALSAFMMSTNLYTFDRHMMDGDMLLEQATILQGKVDKLREDKAQLLLERDNLKHALIELTYAITTMRNFGGEKLENIYRNLANPMNSTQFIVSYAKTELRLIRKELQEAIRSNSSLSTLSDDDSYDTNSY